MDSLPSGTPWRAAPQGTRRNDLQTWEAEDAHHVCQVLTASIVGASSGDYLFVAPIQTRSPGKALLPTCEAKRTEPLENWERVGFLYPRDGKVGGEGAGCRNRTRLQDIAGKISVSKLDSLSATTSVNP